MGMEMTLMPMKKITREVVADRLKIAVEQIVEMPPAIDALAGAFGMRREMGQVFKVVDDLEYPLYYIYIWDGDDMSLSRHILRLPR